MELDRSKGMCFTKNLGSFLGFCRRILFDHGKLENASFLLKKKLCLIVPPSDFKGF